MRSVGCDYYDLQTCVGQSVGTVMSAHYDHSFMERLGEDREAGAEDGRGRKSDIC